MSLVTFLFLVIVMAIYLGLASILNVGVTILIAALLTFIQAIVFTRRPDLNDRFLSLITPKLYRALMAKDQVFIDQRRKSNIIRMYVLSILMAINGMIQLSLNPNISNSFLNNKGSIMIFVLFTLVISSLAIILSISSIKKSETASEDLVRNEISGLGISVVMLIGIFIFTVVYFKTYI